MRPAGHDASSPGRNCDVRGSDTPAVIKVLDVHRDRKDK